MNKYKLLKHFIKTNGNASKAGRLAGISEGHARKILAKMTVKDAKKEILKTERTSEILLPLTDIHYGEQIVGTQLNGYNEYNSSIAKQRINSIFEDAKSFISDHDETIHIVNMGDAISGMLHDESVVSDEMTPMVAINEIGRFLISKILELYNHFPHVNIEIYGLTSNHGRNTRKIWAKNSIETSYDYQLGQLMEIAFHDNEAINVNDVKDHILVNVANVQWAMSHGHWHTGGTVAGAFKGAAFQRIQALEQLYLHNGYQVDAVMIGHFHAKARLNNWFVCPALCGPSEFETKKLGIKPHKPNGMILRCIDGEIEDINYIKV